MNYGRQEQPEIDNTMDEDKITVPSNNGITRLRAQDILMSYDDAAASNQNGPSGRLAMINKMNNPTYVNGKPPSQQSNH